MHAHTSHRRHVPHVPPASHVALLCGALLASTACRHAAPVDAPRPAAEDGASSASAAASDQRSRQLRSRDVAESAEWRGRPIGRVEELLVGRFPGVQVLTVRGQGIAVRIRGSSSIYGNQEPLYVLDGVPMAQSPGGLLNINPADVARIEVLKDIGSISMYGIRGANGVVLITTKRSQ
jgi:TonB-dependent SusC/RagA subfamily outer membrane receptor